MINAIGRMGIQWRAQEYGEGTARLASFGGPTGTKGHMVLALSIQERLGFRFSLDFRCFAVRELARATATAGAARIASRSVSLQRTPIILISALKMNAYRKTAAELWPPLSSSR